MLLVSMNPIVQRVADQAWYSTGLLLSAPANDAVLLQRAAIITTLVAHLTPAAVVWPNASALAV